MESDRSDTDHTDAPPTGGDDEDQSDVVHTAPATSGHSDADSQAERNREDESPG